MSGSTRAKAPLFPKTVKYQCFLYVNVKLMGDNGHGLSRLANGQETAKGALHKKWAASEFALFAEEALRHNPLGRRMLTLRDRSFQAESALRGGVSATGFSNI